MERLCLNCKCDISGKSKKAKVCGSSCYSKWYWSKHGASISVKRSDYQKEYREKNKERIKNNLSKWYSKNRQSVLKKSALYYRENSDSIKDKAKTWRLEHADKKAESDKQSYRRNIKKRMVIAARKRAKSLGVPFDLKETDFEIPEICPALGLFLKVSDTIGPDSNSPTLDRVEPYKGYVAGNVKVISCRANRIKTDASVDEIYAVAIWLEEELRGK